MIIPDKKKAATVIVAQMHSPNLEIEEEEGSEDEECSALGQELLEAVGAKDAMGVYNALRAIFQKVDSEPHAEGEHEEDEGEDY